jgi:uncharacterized phage protein (TIGR01671 family)
MIPKFRAWGKKENKMFEVMCLGLAKGAKTELWSSIKYHHLSVVPSVLKKYYVLMQSIGLNDKNGKEIFEGDIIKFQYKRKERLGVIRGFTVFGNLIQVVEFGSIYFRDIAFREKEVIGNIYENPELLKEMNP